jgi:hypothetical protein
VGGAPTGPRGWPSCAQGSASRCWRSGGPSRAGTVRTSLYVGTKVGGWLLEGTIGFLLDSDLNPMSRLIRDRRLEGGSPLSPAGNHRLNQQPVAPDPICSTLSLTILALVCFPGSRGGYNDAWAGYLALFLAKNFPCGGAGHTVKVICVSGVGTAHWMTALAQKRSPYNLLPGADLVLIDAAANDVDAVSLPGGTPGHTRGHSVQRQTELLLRTFLKDSASHHPSTDIVWITLGWRERMASPPFHLDAEDEHAEVLRYYGRDHLSYLQSMQPLAPAARREWINDALFVDGHGHLSVLGHQMAAQVVGHYLHAEATADAAADDTVPPLTDLPPLFYVTAGDLDRLSLPELMKIVYTRTNPETSPPRGWTSMEDVPGKLGMIATSSSADPLTAHFSTTRPSILLSLGVLMSYEHMGLVHAKLITGGKAVHNATWDCLWAVHGVSVGEVFSFEHVRAPTEGTEYTVSITVASSDRAENKVKLHHMTVQ